MKRDITDFSMKDSSEYNKSVSMYADALDEVDSDLLSFEESFKYRDPIPTKLREKTHNSPDFLDEDRIAKRKMNADTNAVQELSEKYKNLKEELMFGSNQDDLEAELIQGGLGLDVLKAFKKHGVTGKAIWDSLKSLKSFLGADPSVMDAINELKDKANVVSDESDEDVEDETSTDESEEETADEEDSVNEDEDLDEESDNEDAEVLSEKIKRIQKRIAEKRLRDML